AGDEKHRGWRQDAAPVDQAAPGSPARRGRLQHGMRGEEGREHHDVAEYKDPEAVADDHALGGRAAFAAPGCIDVSPASAGAHPVTAAPDPVWIARALEWGVGRAHAG